MNKTEPPVTLPSGTVHGCSNGNLNKWEKVKFGRVDFLEKYIIAEKIAKGVGNDEVKLEESMAEYAGGLHKLMLNDRLNDYSDVESGYPWHFEKQASSIFARNCASNFATVSTQVLIIHKTGLAYISENTYTH